MLLSWWFALAGQALLLASLQKTNLYAFRHWVGFNFAVSLIEIFLRADGPVYAFFWQLSSLFLLLPMALSVIEATRLLHSDRSQLSLLIAAAISIPLHAILQRHYLWPSSSLETTYAIVSIFQFCMGLFLAQEWAAGLRREQKPHAAILATYLLGNAVCLYSATAFPNTIWIATIALEVGSAWAWLALALYRRR